MRGEAFLDKQSYVIECTIMVEDIINQLLYNNVGLIGLPKKEMEKTKTFKSSSPVPIKTKIDLLYDLDYFDLEIYKRLIKQTEIRNVFAHNYSIVNYTDCYNLLDGKKTLSDLYLPLQKGINEENIQKAIENLFLKNIQDLQEVTNTKNQLVKNHTLIYKTYNFLFEEYSKTIVKTIYTLEKNNNKDAILFLKKQLQDFELFLAKNEETITNKGD